MRYFILILFLSFTLCGRSIEAFYSYSNFYSPTSGPYVETYISIIGQSISYVKTENGTFQGNTGITILFKQGEEIKNFKKYNLLSPEISDTTDMSLFSNFIDQQRFSLPNGNYDIEIQISDNNSKSVPFKSIQPVKVNIATDKIYFSDIELIESYKKTTTSGILTKSGYDLVPYVSNFYPKSMDKLLFYCEIYNTDKILGLDEKYLVNYFIKSKETGSIFGNYKGFLRQTTLEANVIFNEFNISELPSGNYFLVIEARNKINQELVSTSLFFQRSNPDFEIKEQDLASIDLAGTFAEKISDEKMLTEYIKCLRPISSEHEQRFIDKNSKNATLEIMQKFFYNFWNSRNSDSPEKEWNDYKEKVAEVNKLYKTLIRNGYETDRGRVYLKYGKPNSVAAVKSEPSSYPYEVWHYYKIHVQSNVKFVFYDQSTGTDDYQLLHSNLMGEPTDYRWQYKLQRRNTSNTDFDDTKGTDHFGTRSEDYYNTPR